MSGGRSGAPRLAEAGSRRRPRVAMVVAYLSHFRAPLYARLRTELDARGVDFRLLYGVSDAQWSRTLEWAEPFRVHRLPGGATWFPVLAKLARADLVVVEDASRHLLNYALLALRRCGGPKLALWGHGWNHQAPRRGSASEKLKAYVGRRADAFFAYTAGVRAELIARGYDAARIHDVRNTLPAPSALPSADEVGRLRRRLGVPADARVALYCGRMYPLKRLELLVTAAELVKREMPELELVLAGGGPSQGIAEAAARSHGYIHYVGPAFGMEKAACFAVADVCVIPGIVGLAVVDAFHHGVPPIVTRMDAHGPEIEYLEHEVNGLLTDHTAADLAAGIARALRDHDLRARLVAGCKASSATLGIDGTVDRFVHGIMATLDAAEPAGRWSYDEP